MTKQEAYVIYPWTIIVLAVMAGVFLFGGTKHADEPEGSLDVITSEEVSQDRGVGMPSQSKDITAVPIIDTGLAIEYLGDTTYNVGDALPEFSKILTVEGKPYTEYEAEHLMPYIQGFDDYSIYTDVNGMRVFVRPGKINISLARLDTKETIFQVPVTVLE